MTITLCLGFAYTGYASDASPTARPTRDSWLWRTGEIIRGHEFHYSTREDRPCETLAAYELLPNEFQREACLDGAQCDNLFASYVHLHFLARPELASRIVSAASAVRFRSPST